MRDGLWMEKERKERWPLSNQKYIRRWVELRKRWRFDNYQQLTSSVVVKVFLFQTASIWKKVKFEESLRPSRQPQLIWLFGFLCCQRKRRVSHELANSTACFTRSFFPFKAFLVGVFISTSATESIVFRSKDALISIFLIVSRSTTHFHMIALNESEITYVIASLPGIMDSYSVGNEPMYSAPRVYGALGNWMYQGGAKIIAPEEVTRSLQYSFINEANTPFYYPKPNAFDFRTAMMRIWSRRGCSRGLDIQKLMNWWIKRTQSVDLAMKEIKNDLGSSA